MRTRPKDMRLEMNFKIKTTVFTHRPSILAESNDSQQFANNLNDILLYNENFRRKVQQWPQLAGIWFG
jgi:hypothetical protein